LPEPRKSTGSNCDSNFAHAHFILGIVHLRKGVFAEAIAEFQRATTLSPNMTWYEGGLKQAYARSAEVCKLLSELKAFDQRDAGLVINMGLETPMFDPLRSDPRFQELLRRIGLPP